MSLRSLADEAEYMTGMGELKPVPSQHGNGPRPISASPYRWCAPESIPRRPWLYGRQLLRGSAFMIVAPGATGKSSLIAGMAMALCTGRPLLGQQIWEGPQRVWLWNLEDPIDELTRSIQAAAIHWNIAEGDVGDRLFVDSGMEGAVLKLARSTRDGAQIDSEVSRAIVDELVGRKIDVLTIDPFVSSHGLADENDNAAMDTVVKEWGRIAKAANCAIVLVHHSKKMRGDDVTMESSRGGSAATDGVRGGLALNTMKAEEASKFGIPAERRRQYFRADDGKPNRAPAGGGNWYEMVSAFLGNGPNGGDSVGVATPWTPPDPFDDVTPSHLLEAQRRIALGEWASHPSSSNWAGKVIAAVIGADVETDEGKAKVKHVIAIWTKAGRFKIEHRRDSQKGRDVPFLVVGEPVAPDEI